MLKGRHKGHNATDLLQNPLQFSGIQCLIVMVKVPH